MNFLFIIQGEGKGHWSQAIAMKQKLDSQGHRISAVLAGRSKQRVIPPYAGKAMGMKIQSFRSPNFIRTSDRKGIRPGLSILYNLAISPVFILNIFRIRKQILRDDVDVVVNFYDMIAGLANFFIFKRKKFIVLSHHYFLTSGYFQFPEGYFFQKRFLKLHNRICALKADEILALSFREFPSKPGFKIIPPFLREELKTMPVSDEGFILVYLLNEGLIRKVLEIAGDYTAYNFKLYTGEFPQKSVQPDNIQFKKPDYPGFIKDLASCHLLITTAGFESQCEAAFLGKPVFTIASKNHFEQICNAVDGEIQGISMPLEKFSIEFTPDTAKHPSIRNWFMRSDFPVVF